MSFRALAVATPLLLSLGVFACSASGDGASEDQSESDLRALNAPEILGTIAYGESKTFEYVYDGDTSHRYRAYSFQGASGDTVDAWARSTNGGNARLWLLDDHFRTLASNDDASADTRDAHVTHAIRTSGTFYLAVRDAALEDATFTLTLAPAGGDGNGNGGGDPGDPFDPASCSGASVSAAQIMAMLDPPRGVVSKKVGRFTVLQRQRSCYPNLPCSEWTSSVTRPVTAPFETLHETFTTATAPRFHLKTEGDVVAKWISNRPQLSLEGDVQQDSWGGPYTPDYVRQALTTTFDPTAAVTASPIVSYTWMPSRGCPNGHCEGNESVPGTSATSWAGASFSVSGKATASCIHLSAHASEAVKDAQQNDYTLESQIVLRGDFSAASCHPTTCAEAQAACGSISDGCGGTLSCGTCASGQTCDTQGKNHCRPMTAEEQCGAEGRVYCPGHGGCWDACF